MSIPTETTPAVASIPAETVEGWALLKPLNDIPSWDLVDLWEGLSDIYDDFGGPVAPGARTVAKILRLMLVVAVDTEEFTRFASGPGGMQRSSDLAMAWMAELGKSVGSGS